MCIRDSSWTSRRLESMCLHADSQLLPALRLEHRPRVSFPRPPDCRRRKATGIERDIVGGCSALNRILLGQGQLTRGYYCVPQALSNACLLYTSDAADERSSVDLG